jgi:hypothetical protein
MGGDLAHFWHKFEAFGHRFLEGLMSIVAAGATFPSPMREASPREKRHLMFIDLRFLLAILMGWTG